MTTPLRILLLEDSVQDAELIQELLEEDHFVCEVTRVQTRAEFVAALENGAIDLVLADYALPSFDGLSALQLTRSARPDLPFIFVSGFGEEIAIEADERGQRLCAEDRVVTARAIGAARTARSPGASRTQKVRRGAASHSVAGG